MLLLGAIILCIADHGSNLPVFTWLKNPTYLGIFLVISWIHSLAVVLVLQRRTRAGYNRDLPPDDPD